MAKHIVMCRVCRQKFDTNALKENLEWMQPSPKMYYHTQCYTEWKQNKGDIHANGDDNFWFLNLKEYLAKDLKIGDLNYQKMTSQWRNYLKQGKTAKGIFFAMKYHYDVMHGDVNKSLGGIGIISSIYEEACAYWHNNTEHVYKICECLSRQAEEKQEWEQNIRIIKQQNKPTVKKPRFNLDDI